MLNFNLKAKHHLMISQKSNKSYHIVQIGLNSHKYKILQISSTILLWFLTQDSLVNKNFSTKLQLLMVKHLKLWRQLMNYLSKYLPITSFTMINLSSIIKIISLVMKKILKFTWKIVRLFKTSLKDGLEDNSKFWNISSQEILDVLIQPLVASISLTKIIHYLLKALLVKGCPN